MLPIIVTAMMQMAAEPAVQYESLKDGYRVTLSRDAAERMRDLLLKVDREKEIAEWIREQATLTESEERAERLEMIALILANHIPALRESMRNNVGDYGSTIRVFGTRKDTILAQPRPRLRRIIEGVKLTLPRETRAGLDNMMDAAKVTPLIWNVDPRN